MMNNKISIIIPAYNVEQYIGKAIESSLNQSYGNVEVIVVDDGSTDRTLYVAESYLPNSKLVCFSQTNSGVSSARNAGLRLASGDFVLFLDSDDWLESNACEVLMHVQHQHPGYLVTSDYYSVELRPDSTSERISQCVSTSSKCLSSDKALLSFGVFDSFHVGSSCYKLFMSDVIKQNSICFDETIYFVEDGLFVFEYLKHCDGIFYEPQPLWNILDREGSATKSVFNRKQLTSLNAINKMLSYEDNPIDVDASLRVFRAHEALRIIGCAVETDLLKTEEYEYLLSLTDKMNVDKRQLSLIDKIRTIVYTHFPSTFIHLFNTLVVNLKRLK